MSKATVSAIKKAVAAARELAAAIMAGSWVVAVITLIICIVGLLVTSPFGLFFSDPGSGMTIPEAVAQLNGEFTAQIEQIKTDNPYDTLDMDESSIAAVTDNWTNVLAVYSVRVSSGDGTGASILTSENLAVLRETFWDMTEITYAIETMEHEDEDDEIILHISVTTKTAQQIADEYGFTEEQKALLEEILKPEYQDLFQSLIGSNQSITLSPQEVQEILSRLPDDLSEQRRQVVLTAYQLLGKVNYFWGGKSLVLGWDSRWGTPKEVWAAGSPSTGTIRPYGLDCSGFVDWVFYNVSGGSYVIGHGGGASAQHSYCTAITWADAQPGDLVFYPGDSHVGIVCGFDSGGNIQIIHCASGSNNVVVTGKIGFTTIARPNYYS
nr:NlpC/P60 family protein [uncultured Oscillibacter sp.]